MNKGRFVAGRFTAGRFTAVSPGVATVAASVSGIINNPAYGATAQIGTVLTGTLNNLVGGEVIVHRWRTSAGLIAGANAATYAVALGGNVTVAGNIWYSPTVDAVEVNSVAHTVRHAAPTLASSITDKLYELDEAIPNFDAAAHFGGAGATYAFAPASAAVAGLSISGAGLLTGTPTALVAAAAVIIRCTNSGGYADAGFQVTVADVPDRMDPPAVVTTGTTTISVDRASTPANNNSPIDLYQARWRAAPSGSWTTVSDIADPDTLTGLPSDTLIDVQTRCRNAIGFGSWSLSASDTTDAPTGDAAVDYGALTLAGHGGLALPAGAASITNAGGTNLEVSTGMVVPAAGGGVSSGTVVFNNGTEWTVTALADTYHITGTTHANSTEFTAAIAAAGANLAGTEIRARVGAKLGDCVIAAVITGTLTIAGETGGAMAQMLSMHSADIGAAGKIHYQHINWDSADAVGPTLAVYEHDGTGDELILDQCRHNGIFDPVGNGWAEDDFYAQIIVDGVLGGAPAVGNIIRAADIGNGETRCTVHKVVDNLDGTYNVWMADHLPMQNTARNIRDNQLLTLFSTAADGTETGVTMVANGVAFADNGFDLHTNNANTNPNRNFMRTAHDSSLRKTTFRDCVIKNCGRPWTGQTELEVVRTTVDTFYGDGFNPGHARDDFNPPPVVIQDNVFTRSHAKGPYATNPHGDCVQLSQKAKGNWKGIVITNNIHYNGGGPTDMMSFFLEIEDPTVYVEGAIIEGNHCEGGMAISRALACRVAGNTMGYNWDLDRSASYSAIQIGTATDGGGNRVYRNVSGYLNLASGVTSLGNVTLSEGNYDDAFVEAEPWAAATTTIAATLARYTPKSGGTAMVGGHAAPWIAGSDAGAIDSAGLLQVYDDTPAVPGTPLAADISVTQGAGAGTLDFQIVQTVEDNFAAITSAQYTVDGGTSWADLIDHTPGLYSVTQHSDGTTGNLSNNINYSCAVRFVNAHGPGAGSPAMSVESGPAAFAAQGIDMSLSGLIEYPIPTAGQISAGEKKLLLSFWVYVPTTWVVYGNLVAYKAGNAERITVVPVSASRLGLLVYNDASVVIGQLTTSVDAMAVDTWHHLLISYDSTSGGSGLQLTVNGVPAALGTNVQPATDDLLPSGVNKFQIHDYQPGNPHYIAEYYEYIGQSLDLTVPANVEKFRDATGDPVSLGADGSVPLGSAPTRYMSGSAATWNVDKANGRTLTVAGSALAAAPSDPGD